MRFKGVRVDLEKAKNKEIGDALIDRLELTEERIDAMIAGLKIVAELPDPVGEIEEMKPTPSGLEISKMRVPLGVVGIIYESRPNVTIDAAGLCLKSGNAVILRSGKDGLRSASALVTAMQKVQHILLLNLVFDLDHRKHY